MALFYMRRSVLNIACSHPGDSIAQRCAFAFAHGVALAQGHRTEREPPGERREHTLAHPFAPPRDAFTRVRARACAGRQSRASSCPSTPSADAIWSITPHGAPTCAHPHATGAARDLKRALATETVLLSNALAAAASARRQSSRTGACLCMRAYSPMRYRRRVRAGPFSSRRTRVCGMLRVYAFALALTPFRDV
eukprot:6196379-Pleurochrysis_carterae.AAC.6